MKLSRYYLIAAILIWNCVDARAQFTTTINSPPTAIGGQTIGSNTQINVMNGGSVGNFFDVPSKSASAPTNVEINISGGTVGTGLRILGGGTASISGGNLRGFSAYPGSVVNVSGGALGGFVASSGSVATLSGGEFRLDGTLIAGLDTVGSTIALNGVGARLLSGTLADGTPFAFLNADGDGIADGTLTLKTSALPAINPTIVTLPGPPVPLGIRGSQLVVSAGAVVGNDFSAGRGSVVRISGGQTGDNFEALAAQINVTGGFVGDNFDAFQESAITISGGSVGGGFDAYSGSRVQISGGTVGDYFGAYNGSEISISGGAIGTGFSAHGSSKVSISGGSFGTFFSAHAGSTLNISGGTFSDDFNANSGSKVNLIGTQFLLNNVDITNNLSQNIPFTISQRNTTLSGYFADGSPFSFDLNTTNGINADTFSSGATLTVTLVEPGDFDFDGDVDARDFLAWQRNPGIGSLAAWQANYGIGPLSATSTAVPEPTLAMSVLAALLAIAARRR